MDLLARIKFDPGEQEPLRINWPAGLAPTGVSAPRGQQALPQADVLVITWTAAEARALADVLTPGTQSTDWVHYAMDWYRYENQLTERSPAREANRLGSWAEVTINNRRVVCFKSELHPATDAPSLPTAQLAAAIQQATGASTVITTGTAGGAGTGTRLGDVNLAGTVRSYFTTRLKGNPFSQQAWQCTSATVAQERYLDEVAGLAPQGRLPAEYAGAQPAVWHGDTVSTDFFAYDTADDHFGLRAYAPAIRAVEMDDAAVALGVGARAGFMSIRNASDPVMPDASEGSAHTAEEIYQKYGYWTTVGSALATWAVIAGK